MTTKSTFVECNRETTTTNIYHNDNYRWRTTLREGFNVKKGDQIRMNMAVLSLLGTGDYIELTDTDLAGDTVIVNPYAPAQNQTQKEGTGMNVSFYYTNNDYMKGKCFVYGDNPPKDIAGTNPTTTFDNKPYMLYRNDTTIESLGEDDINGDDVIGGNSIYGYDNPLTILPHGYFISKKSGFWRNKINMCMETEPNNTTPDAILNSLEWGFSSDGTTFDCGFLLNADGNYSIFVSGVEVYTGGVWVKGDRFKIQRRLHGLYFKQLSVDSDKNVGKAHSQNGMTDCYDTIYYHQRLTEAQVVARGDNYGGDVDEPDYFLYCKNTSNVMTYYISDNQHIKLLEYLRSDKLDLTNGITGFNNPKMLHKRDDDGYFIDKDGNRINDVDKDTTNPHLHLRELGLGALESNAFNTNFLFDGSEDVAFDFMKAGFYSESDIATRITENMNNVNGYYPYSDAEGTNPSGSKGLLVNGLLWMNYEATATDTAEYIFINKYWYKPLPPLNELFCLYFPSFRSLVGATSPVCIYNDDVSRFEIQYLHAPYKLQSGNDKGDDVCLMCVNTGSWRQGQYPKKIDRAFLEAFGGVSLNFFINTNFWSKLGYATMREKYKGGYFLTTGADQNISYNSSFQQYALPDDTKAQPDSEDQTGIKRPKAKSSGLRAESLPLKVEFPYFLMLTNLPISGVGNKYYANDGGIYNCLGHIARNYSALDFIYQLDGNTFTVDDDAYLTYIDIDIRLPNMKPPPNITSYSSVILEFISTIGENVLNQDITISQINPPPPNKKPEDDRDDNREDKRDDNRDTYKK